jgi:general secretion pathway protein F
MIIVAGFAIWGFRRWRRSPKGREAWDRFVLRLKLVGPLVRMISVGRFARTLGTMLQSGVPLLKALDITKQVLGNTVLQKVVEEARDSIREGESVATPLRRSGHFPPTVVHMIAVGERSGQLEQMLDYVATSYETETELRLQRLTTLLEPLMIVAMAGVVAFIIFSILWPILQMNQMIAA